MSVGCSADGVRMVVRVQGPCTNASLETLIDRTTDTMRATFPTAHAAAEAIRRLGDLESARSIVSGAYVQFGADGPVLHMIMSTAFGLHPQPAHVFVDFADEIEETEYGASVGTPALSPALASPSQLTPLDAGEVGNDIDDDKSVAEAWDLVFDEDELTKELNEMLMC